MRILDVTLPTPNPERVTAFYRSVLQLPVAGGTVQIGTTSLRVVPGPDAAGSHHIAFNIPADGLDRAATWLKARCEPMSQDGQELFHFDPPFDADSIYFLDPDGTILELIARRASPRSRTSGAFAAREILSVSEVAVAVASVPEAARLLGTLGLHPIGGGFVPEDDDFAAIGGHDGMIILTEPTRPWMPTRDRLPNPTPTVIVADVKDAVVLANGTRIDRPPRRS